MSTVRPLARTNARKAITRESHGAVLELHKDTGIPDANRDWHRDLRRGRLCIYGGILRWIDTTIESGKPELAEQAVAWLSWYVKDQTNPTDTAEIKLAA